MSRDAGASSRSRPRYPSLQEAPLETQPGSRRRRRPGGGGRGSQSRPALPRDQARKPALSCPRKGLCPGGAEGRWAAGECAAEDLGGGTLRRASAGPELPGRAGAGQVARLGVAEFRRPACGVAREAESGGAGIPGLVSSAACGGGERPQEPAGHEAGRGPAGKGLPAQPPGLRRATAVEGSARGSGPWGPLWDPAWVGMGEGARTWFSRALGAEWVKSRDRGSGEGLHASSGPGQVSPVN